MRYDIVIVSYNSERWLPDCIRALSNLTYDLSQLHIILVDNGSRPACIEVIRQLEAQYTAFGNFTVILSSKNLGFGGGCNLGARQGDAPYIFMLNADTEICPDALSELDRVINGSDPTAGAFELRQKPWETGHHHDPVTMETDWNSGACVVYPRHVFELVEGFDENIFLYCEDVDISWRIRAYGYKLLYVPRAAVYHYTRQPDPAKTKEFREYIWTQYTKLMLHYKYGSFKDRHNARKAYLETLRHPVHYDYVRRVLLKNYLRHFFEISKFSAWRRSHKALLASVPTNYSDGFTTMRSLYTCRPLSSQPLVSVIIRACGKGEVLRETLRCFRHQTYQNYEIVLEEDGQETLRKMLEEEFCDLPISYEATGQKVGRSKAGNRALSRAKGQYFNFLDSDDFFYPEHLELMVSTFQQHPDADIVLSGYMQYNVDILCSGPVYVRSCVSMEYHAPSDITLPVLCQSDPIPILSVMFRRELFEQKGGLREDIDSNEDWAMWLRFFTLKPKVYSNQRATCAFIFPNDPAAKNRKLDSYHVNHNKVYDDDSLVFPLTARQLKDYFVAPENGKLITHLPIFE